ncbi:MAG: hypothetical protein P4L45_06310 [Ignavibacteriaceae bacterium]|nr:hypothetical protein [Ignavibacteriaceae bacterium]
MKYFNCSVFSLCIFSFIVFTFQSCTNPISPANGFTLSVADVSCTEAWLNLHVNTAPAIITINKNGAALFTMKVTTRDTTIYDSTLSPGKNYTYQALVTGIKSNQATARTMDTTSHNFRWQLYTLGDALAGNGSMLYDAAIINENDIWVVGEIYLKDSVQMYNAAHWDGQKWNLKSIYFNYNGQNLISTIRAVYAFNANDIWFGMGSMIHWNGRTFESISNASSFPSLVNRIYGTSDNDLYVIGNSGNIARYNGTSWSKIQSGTTLYLLDIYSNNSNDIYIAGGNFLNYDGILLKGTNDSFQTLNEGKNITADQLFHPYFSGLANTIWVSSNGSLYFGGNFLYRYKFGQYNLVKTLPGNYFGGNATGQYWGFISKIRGNADNDIFMAGEGNTVRHFNGVTWQQLGMPYDYNSPYLWLSINVKNNTVAVAGYKDRNAVVLILKRQ